MLTLTVADAVLIFTELIDLHLRSLQEGAPIFGYCGQHNNPNAKKYDCSFESAGRKNDCD